MPARLLWCLLSAVALATLAACAASRPGAPAATSPRAAAAQEVSARAPIRPNRILVIVTRTAITVDNETPGAERGDKIWGMPGGTIVFVIKNEDSVQHSVMIPLAEFKPYPEGPELATAEPLGRKQTESIDVAPGARQSLTFQIQRLPHFRFDQREPWKSNPALGMRYKYTIYSTPAGGARIVRDPDLEVDQP